MELSKYVSIWNYVSREMKYKLLLTIFTCLGMLRQNDWNLVLLLDKAHCFKTYYSALLIEMLRALKIDKHTYQCIKDGFITDI